MLRSGGRPAPSYRGQNLYQHDFADRTCVADTGALQADIGHRDFPAWHFAMLNDEPRNRAIEAAIAALDLRDKTVFEIGAGTGLIALLFAKHGARHVYTCEMNASLGGIAADVIAASPYRDRITLFPFASHEVIDANLLPGTPDVIFTETVDCGVIGEGYFAVRRDIQRIAGPHTIILPTRIEQHGSLVESPTMHGLNAVGTVCGFDLSMLNRFASTTYFPVRAALYPYQLLTDWKTVRSYHYGKESAIRYSLGQVDRGGVAHGLLTWFSLHFGTHAVSNCVGLNSHWHQAFHPLPEPREVAAGDIFRLQVDDSGASVVSGPLP